MKSILEGFACVGAIFFIAACSKAKVNDASNECLNNCGSASSTESTNLAAVAQSSTLFDFIRDMKIQATTNNFIIVRKVPSSDLPNQLRACQFSYSSTLNPQLSNIDDPTTNTQTVATLQTYYQKWNQPVWRMAEWGSLDNKDSFCDSPATVTKANGMITLSRPSYGSNVSKLVQIRDQSISLFARSVDHFKALFGEVFYRDGTAKNWAAMLLSTKYPRVDLGSNGRKLNLTLKATLRDVTIRTDNITTTPIPLGAQSAYDPRKHGTHFRFFLPVDWKSSACPAVAPNASVAANYPSYCKFQNKGFHFGVNLFDERKEHDTGQVALDIDTNMQMYGQDLRALIPGAVANDTATTPFVNPFKVVGVPAALNVNLMPHLRWAIFKMETMQNNLNQGKGEADKIYYIPPRIVTNNVAENDIAYVAHFGISSVNIGYEVPGLSSILFDVNDFKLVLVP